MELDCTFVERDEREIVLLNHSSVCGETRQPLLIARVASKRNLANDEDGFRLAAPPSSALSMNSWLSKSVQQSAASERGGRTNPPHLRTGITAQTTPACKNSCCPVVILHVGFCTSLSACANEIPLKINSGFVVWKSRSPFLSHSQTSASRMQSANLSTWVTAVVVVAPCIRHCRRLAPQRAALHMRLVRCHCE